MTESVREKALEKMYFRTPDGVSKTDCEELLSLPELRAYFLSQPSGLRAVRECDNCEGTGRVQPMLALYDGKCPLCTNGLRSREIPISEAVEWAIKAHKALTEIKNAPGGGPGRRIATQALSLLSSERVEVG